MKLGTQFQRRDLIQRNLTFYQTVRLRQQDKDQKVEAPSQKQTHLQ